MTVLPELLQTVIADAEKTEEAARVKYLAILERAYHQRSEKSDGKMLPEVMGVLGVDVAQLNRDYEVVGSHERYLQQVGDADDIGKKLAEATARLRDYKGETETIQTKRTQEAAKLRLACSGRGVESQMAEKAWQRYVAETERVFAERAAGSLSMDGEIRPLKNKLNVCESARESVWRLEETNSRLFGASSSRPPKPKAPPPPPPVSGNVWRPGMAMRQIFGGPVVKTELYPLDPKIESAQR